MVKKNIKGDPAFSQQTSDVISQFKEHEEALLKLISEVFKMRSRNQVSDADTNVKLSPKQFQESQRCLSIAKEHIQTAEMWVTRSIELPS